MIEILTNAPTVVVDPPDGGLHKLTNPTPNTIVVVGMVIAFLVFALLNLAELQFQKYLPPQSTRILQFLWGFFSTAGGMLLIWRVMRKKEIELTILRKVLASDLARKAIALEETTKHLELASGRANTVSRTLHQQREDILSVLNHRLRGPLAANERTILLLQEGAFGGLTPKQVEILHLLGDNNTEIIRLLKMLTTLFGFQTGQTALNFRNIKVTHLLQEVRRKMNASAAAKNLTHDFNTANISCVLNCDVDHIQTLFSHLIENAIKYASSAVKVSAHCADHNITLRIEDDGCGVEVADIPNLFTRFYQVSKSGKYPASTGVGLCLCREIAIAHNGSIACERIADAGGTRFLVTLPCKCSERLPA